MPKIEDDKTALAGITKVIKTNEKTQSANRKKRNAIIQRLLKAKVSYAEVQKLSELSRSAVDTIRQGKSRRT